MGGPPCHRGDPPGLRQPAQTYRRYPRRTDATPPCHDQPGCYSRRARSKQCPASRVKPRLAPGAWFASSRRVASLPSGWEGCSDTDGLVWPRAPRVVVGLPRARPSVRSDRFAAKPFQRRCVPPESGFAGGWRPGNYRNSLPVLPHSGERRAAGRSVGSPLELLARRPWGLMKKPAAGAGAPRSAHQPRLRSSLP